MSDKPPFNPNVAFQPVTDSKPAFDPSQPHTVVDQATAAPVDNGNWKKLSQLGGMATPGSEWSAPDDETVNDPTVRQAMKSQAQTGIGIGLGGDRLADFLGKRADSMNVLTPQEMESKKALIKRFYDENKAPPAAAGRERQAQQPQGDSRPKTVQQNGHTYTLNPATGQYE